MYTIYNLYIENQKEREKTLGNRTSSNMGHHVAIHKKNPVIFSQLYPHKQFPRYLKSTTLSATSPRKPPARAAAGCRTTAQAGARLSAVPRPRNQGVRHAQAYSERERERVMDGEKHGVIISRLVEMSQHAEGVPQGGILR